MKKFEYKAIQVVDPTILNDLGKEGWEAAMTFLVVVKGTLATNMQPTQVQMLLFKRELPE